MDSSFTGSPGTQSSSVSDLVINLTSYIPVGCLRVHRSHCGFSLDQWNTCCTQWASLVLPRDFLSNQLSHSLDPIIQNKLMNSTVLKPFHGLHNAAWIRMQFKTNDENYGQVRIYILPEDVGHLSIDRRDKKLRKSMALLMSRIDTSACTFFGRWTLDTPITALDPSLERSEKDEPSLFYLFNHLPSPKPDPDAVKNRYFKQAMLKILGSDVEGLETSLYEYQRRSAALMIQREAQPAYNLDPRLTLTHDQEGRPYYWDFSNNCCFKEPRRFEASKGGILAETMGLGKTLICLSVILATIHVQSQIPVECFDLIPVREKTGRLAQMAAATLGRAGTLGPSGPPWRAKLEDMEQQQGYEMTNCREILTQEAGYYMIPAPAPRRESRNPVIAPSRKIWLSTATLVVVPSNLFQQWRQEIRKHTTGLNILYVNDLSASLPPAEELREYNILLFSKPRFEKEAKESIDCGDKSRSPLKDIHLLRLIFDEGHTFGNSSNSSKTEALLAVGALQVTSRWIVSGTPTQGLYGMDSAPRLHKSLGNKIRFESQDPEDDVSESSSSVSVSSEATLQQEKLFFKQERKDLEKLGNIATFFLRARPWATTQLYHEISDADTASWAQLVMQPRHGSKSRGNMDCLKATIEGLIIRHRPDDVLQDIKLPPLYQKVVKLEGSVQNKLSLNTFALMIITNAVTSERKDADYFFHPRQRKSLTQLVSNLRTASFFWSGFEEEHLRSTIDNAMAFLGKREVKISQSDEILLCKAIRMGRTVLGNKISLEISRTHEMPFYIDNQWPEEIRKVWSLDSSEGNPTLIGATYLHKVQQTIAAHLEDSNPVSYLLQAKAKFELKNPLDEDRKMKPKEKTSAPMLAGGVTVGEASVSRPWSKTNTASTNKLMQSQLAQAFRTADDDLEIPAQRPYTEMETMSKYPEPKITNLGPMGSTAFYLRLATHVVGNSKSRLNNSLLSDQDTNARALQNEDQAFTRSRQRSSLAFYSQAADSSAPDIPKSEAPIESKYDVIQDEPRSIDRSPLDSTHIISTASAKLSYLMDMILFYYLDEKIIVFYESDNVAWYIAQALECLGIKHLIYAKSLSSARRSQYVVSFNQSPIFRVLLMDVSQAAFGLDISSASRVFFVNPVFSPQVEAQAVKRAHRIGQTRPVYVETLVLKGSIEEVILERRNAMTNEEHQRCKNILDDQTMYDWIRNVQFIDVDADVSGPKQMTELAVVQRAKGGEEGAEMNPDEDLVMEEESPKNRAEKANGLKRKAVAIHVNEKKLREV